MKLILGSGSARRKELLAGLYPEFEVDRPTVEEKVDPLGDPRIEAMNCAMLKGLEIAAKHSRGKLISCDTMVYYKRLIGKPKDRADAFDIISQLQGKTHQVITGVYVKNLETGASLVDYEVSLVTFREMSSREIERYLDQADYLDKAGAYAIQEEGRDLVKEIIGDVNNVIGLPTEKLQAMLDAI
ncbi:MAG: septum formation protein Maf [Tissierellia bacterium]|jgi:septum formation protein|nr:septum formation protein Maf [Tissierellia bacterium]